MSNYCHEVLVADYVRVSKRNNEMNIKEKVQEIKRLDSDLTRLTKVLASEGIREISIRDTEGNHRNIFDKETLSRILEVIKQREKEITKELEGLIK